MRCSQPHIPSKLYSPLNVVQMGRAPQDHIAVFGCPPKTSITQATTTLRALLPHYSAQLITINALTTQPWTLSCALLVLPRCIARLAPKTSGLIQKFVDIGGSLLAFSVGASMVPTLRDKSGGKGRESESLLLAFYDMTTRNHVHLTWHHSRAKRWQSTVQDHYHKST